MPSAGSPQRADTAGALHRVRKVATCQRCDAESTKVVLGPRTVRLSRRAKRVQASPGEHQDSVVARTALRQWGIEAHLDGDNAFTFELLHGLEQEDTQAPTAPEDSFDAAPSRQGKKARVLRDVCR